MTPYEESLGIVAELEQAVGELQVTFTRDPAAIGSLTQSAQIGHLVACLLPPTLDMTGTSLASRRATWTLVITAAAATFLERWRLFDLLTAHLSTITDLTGLEYAAWTPAAGAPLDACLLTFDTYLSNND